MCENEYKGEQKLVIRSDVGLEMASDEEAGVRDWLWSVHGPLSESGRFCFPVV